MKRYVHFILFMLCLLSAVPQAVAQQEQKAFFVHRNDGDFNVFFFSQVDSMVYSRIDVDSVLRDDYVTQEIWTADSVYRIPVAAIDSVSFRKLPTIYKNDVSVIKEDLMTYVVSTDSLTLNLRADVPNDLLPKIGEKLVSTSSVEPLPNGFRGIVETIERADDVIKVYCSRLAIEDAFTQFCSIRSILVYNSRNNSKKKAFGLGDNFFDETFKGEPFVLPLPKGILGFTNSVAISEICKKNYNLSFSGDLDITFTPTRRILSSFIVLPDGEIDLSFSYWDETEVDWNLDLAGNFTIGKEWKLPIPEIPLGGGANCYVDIGAGFALEGDIAALLSSGLTFDTYCFLKYNSKYPEGNMVKLIPKIAGKPLSADAVFGNLSGNFYGFIELGVDYVSKKLDKLGIRFQGGPNWNYFIPLELKKTDLKNKDTQSYEVLAENSFFSLSAEVGGSLEFALFDGLISNVDIGMSIPFWKKTFGPKFEANCVPSFPNISFIGNEFTKKYHVNTTVSDKLLFPVNVGVAIFDETDDIYELEYFSDYQEGVFNEFDIFPSRQKPNHSYKAYPVIKWFGNNLLANPYTELSLSVLPVTENVSGITYDSAVLSGRVKGMVELVNNTYKFGIIYSTSSSQLKSGTKKYCNLSTDNNFDIEITDLEENTVYYYCAFMEVDDEYFYGEVKSFETPKVPDEAVDLGLSVLWAKYNVGASAEGESGGLYGWGDAGGTETSIDVVGSDGVTWVSPLYGGINPPPDICGNASYDIASRMWGGDWRLPSQAEMAELINNCTTEYEVVDGTPGLRFTSNINGNSVFFPAAGDRFGTEYRDTGGMGYYWTGTLVPENKVNAYRMTFDDYGAFENNYPRYIGHSVRAVMPKNAPGK